MGRSGGEDLAPVLLVSGMGGSILNARNKETGFELRVWVRLLLADLEFRKLWSLFNPETGVCFSLLLPMESQGMWLFDPLRNASSHVFHYP